MSDLTAVEGDYRQFLAEFGVQPRAIPPDAAELQARMRQRMVEVHRASGDSVIADHFAQVLERVNVEAVSDRHPIEITLERSRGRIVEAIRQGAHAATYKDVAFVGDFPSGSLNAEARKTKHGYLILVNSGLTFFFRQILVALCMRDEVGAEELEIIAQAIKAYIRHKDPAAGPQPLAGGASMLVSHALERACLDFVIAHEFGHLLSGHLETPGLPARMLHTDVGEVAVVPKSWEQEFEADAVAFSLLLGERSLDRIKKIIDKGETSDSSEAVANGLLMMAALAAPMIFFLVEDLVAKCISAVTEGALDSASQSTHPPGRDRVAQLYEQQIQSMGMYLRYVNLAKPLLDHGDWIVERVKTLLPGE